MFFKIWGFLFLLICGAIDLKTKKVYQSLCIINYGVATVIKLFINETDLPAIAGGLIVCGALLIISLVTKEAIGQGDVLILLALSGILNFKNTIEIFFMALFLCSFFSLAILLMRKVKGKDTVPFVPFLFVGYGVWFMLGGYYV